MKRPIYTTLRFPLSLFLSVFAAAGSLQAREGINWVQLSTIRGEIPPANGSNQQTTCVVADVDNDGDQDIFISDRSTSPSVILLLREAEGWQRLVIHGPDLNVEAGGVAGDIDLDGDLDLVLGQDSSGGSLWWLENPFLPDGLDPQSPWILRTIKNGGQQQHDQAFGDFDNDGRNEIATWVNRSNRVEIYGLPEDPAGAAGFPLEATLTMSGEGMSACDVNADGTPDILAGGHWLSHNGSGYDRNPIDPQYNSGNIAGGQFVPGGYAEVVICSADGVNSLNFYRHDGSRWNKEVLIPEMNHGHSLDLGDIDQDGNLDIFAAEMGNPGAGDACRAFICWGDGQGGFVVELVSTGIANHMSRLADLDGDGDLDIVMKPYSFGAPRLDVFLNNGTQPKIHDITQWERHQIDNLPSRAVFVESADLDGDKLPDLVAGGHWWRNPGALDGVWTRQAVGPPFNNFALAADLDQDGDIDLIGTEGTGSTSNRSFVWAENTAGSFTVRTIGDAPGGDFLQGVAMVDSGGSRFAALSWHNLGGGIHGLSIPEDPVGGNWFFFTLSQTTEGEDLSLGDIDLDGDPDLALGRYWLENDSSWITRDTGISYDGLPDRNSLADVDQDGDLDIVVGLENGTDISWAENPRIPSGSATGAWNLHLIGSSPGQGFSMDVADADHDGDPDVVVGEHRGSPDNRLFIFVNEGRPDNWSLQLVDSQSAGIIDHHDGALFRDMDLDGDLDLISIGWDNQKLWIFENTFSGTGIQPDLDPPQVVAVTAASATRVTVRFDEPVSAASAENPGNYSLDQGVNVLGAQLQADAKTVVLAVSGLTEGAGYQLTVAGVADRAEPPNTMVDPVSNPFSYQALDLLAYWPFSEGEGGGAADASGNGWEATLVGPAWTEGKYGNGLAFDGSDDRVQVDGFNVAGSAMTIAAWILADRLDHLSSNDARIISKASGTAEQDHVWMLSTIASGGGTRLRFRLKTGTATSTLVASSGNLTTGAWYHAAAVYDGSVMRLFLDGTEVGSLGKSGTISQSADPVWIGDNPPGAGDRPFDGALDEIRIYGEALSAAQLLAVMEEGPPPESPYALWQSAYFSPAQLQDAGLEDSLWGNHADPDQDRIHNLMEYFLGLSPLSADDFPSFTFDLQPSSLTLAFPANASATDITVTLQLSPDLVNWTDGSGPVTVGGLLPGGMVGKFFSLPLSSQPLFVRFSLSL